MNSASGNFTFSMIMKLTLAFALCSFAILAAADQPNVLFIAVDDLRPELGCYGNTIVKSPNIDRLASRGIVFNHAYVQQAVCSPSRTSLMTGLRRDVTKVWDLETHFRVAQPECVTLPQYLKANGYHCAALSKIYHKGFEDGRSWSEPHGYPPLHQRPHSMSRSQISRRNLLQSSLAFADGVEIEIRLDGDNGILFEGTEGRIFVNRGKLTGGPVEELKTNPLIVLNDQQAQGLVAREYRNGFEISKG